MAWRDDLQIAISNASNQGAAWSEVEQHMDDCMASYDWASEEVEEDD